VVRSWQRGAGGRCIARCAWEVRGRGEGEVMVDVEWLGVLVLSYLKATVVS